MSSIVPSPPVSPDADATTRGVVNPTAADQTLGAGSAIHRFANLITSAVATLASVVTSLVRAVGVSLVLKSDLGTLLSDTVLKVGTSRSYGEIHQSAKLLYIASGIGGTEVSTAWFTKYALNLDGRGATNTSPLILTNLGAGECGIIMMKSGGGSLEFTEGNYDWGNNLWQIRSTNRPIAISVVGDAYVPGRPQALLLSANYDWTVPVVRVAASAGHTGSVWAAAVGTTDVALVSANGRIDQSGTDSSGTPGNATINKPIGKSAIASGATTVTITNSLVAAGDHVDITWHGDLGAQSKIPWVTTAAGSFTVNVGTAPGSAVAFCWRVSKRI